MLLCLLVGAPLHAQTLRWAPRGDVLSMDPHVSLETTTINVNALIHDGLVEIDAHDRIVPALATSWTVVEPMLWRFKLRRGVRFQDGTPFTADDVVFSMERAGRIPNSPAPFSGSVRGIAGMTVVDAHTIRFRTKQPTPEFIEQIGRVYIVSKKVAEGKRSEDFTSPAVAVGTGPYKLREFVPADHLTLVRNDAYWGKKPAFDNVTIVDFGQTF